MAQIVRIFDSNIVGMFDSASDAAAFANKNTREIYRAAVAAVPERSGELKRAHRQVRAIRRGPYVARGLVEVNARHATWVHDGTSGPILPKNGRYLKIPYAGGAAALEGSGRTPRRKYGESRESQSRGKSRRTIQGWRAQRERSARVRNGYIYVEAVRGQQANPWLEAAARAVVARYV